MRKNIDMISLILKIFGTAILLNGIFVCAVSNINLGNFLTAGVGAFIFLSGLYYEKAKQYTQTGILKVIKIFVVFLICAEIALTGFIAVYGQTDNADYNEEVLVILGAGLRGERVTLPLKMRLDKGVSYHKKNPDALIIVTGGQGPQESVSEASAMKKYLISQGVSENVILTEDRATSTNENMRFSKEIADKYFDKEYSVAVITNNFHIYRSVQIAKYEGFKNVSHLHCGLQWYNLIPCYLRESLAVLKMWVFG